ncbi:MAG: hypothetical protein ACOCWB_02135 [Bacteroidota bacterium]
MHLPFWILIGIFSLKIISSAVMYWVYTSYYPVRIEADIFKYFDDAKIIFSSLEHSAWHYIKLICDIDISHPQLNQYYDKMEFWDRKIDYGFGNDNRTIIKANAIIMLFSFGNIWVHNVFAGFISIFSYLLLYKIIYSYNPKLQYALLISIVLIPSGFFWTSAMLKETIVMLGLACYVYGFISVLTKQKKYLSWLSLIIGIFILLHIKVYVIAALIPASLGFLIAYKLPQKRVSYVYIISMLVLILGIIINNTYLHAVPILEKFADKRNDFIMDVVYYAHAQSYIPIGFIDANIMSFIKDTPASLYRAVFLPWLWNTSSLLGIVPALENLMLIILGLLACFYRRNLDRSQQNIIWFSLIFSITLLWIIGITTPVIGAIVRYKIPVFPFLYSIFALIIDWDKLYLKYIKNEYKQL